MSSRVDVAADGRKVVVVVDATSPDLPPGLTFVLRGNAFDLDGHPCWLGRSGRPPTPREQLEARAPYSPGKSRRERERREPDDDEVTDREAIEWARRQQERSPSNLLAPAVAA